MDLYLNYNLSKSTKMKKSLTKIVFVNFLVFLLGILIVEIFFGNWFSAHDFGPYMREHRLKKNSVYLNYNNQKIFKFPCLFSKLL